MKTEYRFERERREINAKTAKEYKRQGFLFRDFRVDFALFAFKNDFKALSS
jgi:hypothetical protein